MIKITLLYGHPQSPQAFERYYREIHLPLAGRMSGVARLELTRFGPGLDAAPPEYYRMAELYFANAAQLQTTLGSPEGQAVVADLPNFATGGVTVMVGAVEA
jgi:uncharacterized protein (TIGR02118 family)